MFNSRNKLQKGRKKKIINVRFCLIRCARAKPYEKNTQTKNTMRKCKKKQSSVEIGVLTLNQMEKPTNTETRTQTKQNNKRTFSVRIGFVGAQPNEKKNNTHNKKKQQQQKREKIKIFFLDATKRKEKNKTPADIGCWIIRGVGCWIIRGGGVAAFIVHRAGSHDDDNAMTFVANSMN